MSVFHRIDEPLSMASSRYFELAELLYAYEGAVRARLVTEQQVPAAPVVAAHRPGMAAGVDDLSVLAEMTRNDGRFPGIKFTRGGG